MKRFLSPSKKETLLIALMYFLFGLVLCVFSGSILTATIRMLGIFACVFGGYELFTYFSALLIALMYFLFGLVLCVFSGSILTATIRMLGIFACVFGGYELFTYFSAKDQAIGLSAMVVGIPALVFGFLLAVNPNLLLNMFPILAGIFILIQSLIGLSAMVVGIPALVFGFLLAVNPNLLLNMFPILAGIFILIQSLSQLQKAFIFKRSGIASWGMDFAVALVMLVAAVFLMFRPSSVIDMIMTITGWVLIVESVILVFQAFNKHNDIIDL